MGYAQTPILLVMKQTILFSAATLVTLSVAFSSCKKEDNPVTVSPVTRLTATLNGANEKPASTTSPATGTFVGDLNTTTRVLSYTVNYSGFPATDQPIAGHLHRVALADGTGPVDIPFPSLANPIVATTSALRQTQVDSMLNGFYYANIHTPTFQKGAIWGNVKKQ